MTLEEFLSLQTGTKVSFVSSSLVATIVRTSVAVVLVWENGQSDVFRLDNPRKPLQVPNIFKVDP
jgi:hypothetical protein